MKKILIVMLLLFSIIGCKSETDYDQLLVSDKLVFREDFQRGKLDQLILESANQGAFRIMKDFKDSKNNMLKVTLNKGDIVNGGTRAEFKRYVDEKVGDELVYKVDFFIDPQHIDANESLSIFQLHDRPDMENGETWESYSLNPISPPLMIEYLKDTLTVNITDNGVSKSVGISNVTKNKWHTLTVHVKYSTEGFLNVYLDGNSITEGIIEYPTIYNSSVNYVKIGLYHSPNYEPIAVMYFDNFEIYRLSSED